MDPKLQALLDREKESLDQPVSTRVQQSTLRALEAHAERYGLDVSSIIRVCIERTLAEMPDPRVICSITTNTKDSEAPKQLIFAKVPNGAIKGVVKSVEEPTPFPRDTPRMKGNCGSVVTPRYRPTRQSQFANITAVKRATSGYSACSYQDMMVRSGLSRSQLRYVLDHNQHIFERLTHRTWRLRREA